MFLFPLPQRDDRRFLDEGDGLPPSRAGDGRPLCAVQGIPQTLGLAVEDQEDVFVDVAADAEFVGIAVFCTAVNHGQLGERSPADGDGSAVKLVVDQLVDIEKSHGIGFDDLAVGVADDLDFIV